MAQGPAQWAARSAHTDLLPLFADELGVFRSVYQPIVDLSRLRAMR